MEPNVQSTFRFPTITLFEICLLYLCVILGTILIYSENTIVKSIYTFIIFIPIGMNMRDIKAAIGPRLVSSTSILIILNIVISLFGYWPASIGFFLYFIIILHRYHLYKDLTGG